MIRFSYCFDIQTTFLLPNKPLTAGPEYIRFLLFLLAHYISAFKHVKPTV